MSHRSLHLVENVSRCGVVFSIGALDLFLRAEQAIEIARECEEAARSFDQRISNSEGANISGGDQEDTDSSERKNGIGICGVAARKQSIAAG